MFLENFGIKKRSHNHHFKDSYRSKRNYKKYQKTRKVQPSQKSIFDYFLFQKKVLIPLCTVNILLLFGMYMFLRKYMVKSFISRSYLYDFGTPTTEGWRIVKTLTDPPFYIRVHHDDFISDYIVREGLWETHKEIKFREVFVKKCKKNVIFVDVGMNLAFFSLQAASHGCKVIGFEVIKEIIHPYVDSSIFLNMFGDKIKVHRIAVHSESNTMMRIYLGGYNIGGTSVLEQEENTFHKKVNILSVSLDDYFFNSKVVDKILPNAPSEIRSSFPYSNEKLILKIDSEKSELNVLKGCQRLFDDDRIDSIMIELSINAADDKKRAYDVVEFLLKNEFRKVMILHETTFPYYYFTKSGPVTTLYNVKNPQKVINSFKNDQKEDLFFTKITKN